MSADDDTLHLHRSELGSLSVHVIVPRDWIGMASATARDWSADGSTVERLYELRFDVVDALVGLPPQVPCLPAAVWGAVVSLLVEARIRARAIELVDAHAWVPLPRGCR